MLPDNINKPHYKSVLIMYNTHHTMIKKLKTAIHKWLTPSYQSELDRYISSKNPQTTEDVEFAIKQFDERNRTVNYLHQRGEYNTARWVKETY
jgi:hypothetical protein